MESDNNRGIYSLFIKGDHVVLRVPEDARRLQLSSEMTRYDSLTKAGVDIILRGVKGNVESVTMKFPGFTVEYL